MASITYLILAALLCLGCASRPAGTVRYRDVGEWAPSRTRPLAPPGGGVIYTDPGEAFDAPAVSK